MSIEPGVRVIVLDAFGAKLERIAASKPRRGDDFPVVEVARLDEWERAKAEGRKPEVVPWPAEDVEVSDREPVSA